MPSRHEYPVTHMWYTKHKGRTIEWIIDHDPDYLVWMVKTFQDLTPSQAQYFFDRHGKRFRDEFVQDVTPYTYEKGDPEEMYAELCETKDLKRTLLKWRPSQLSLF